MNININENRFYKDENVILDLRATLTHELAGHAYDNFYGISSYSGISGSSTWPDLFSHEQRAVAMENEIRDFFNLPQREFYQGVWDMPTYSRINHTWLVRPGDFPDGRSYRHLSNNKIRWN